MIHVQLEASDEILNPTYLPELCSRYLAVSTFEYIPLNYYLLKYISVTIM